MTKSYRLFLHKINKFITKYHFIKFLQSFFLAIALTLLIFSIVAVVNYFFYFTVTIKTSLFIIVVITISAIFIELVLIPLLPLLNFKRLSIKDAATLVQKLSPDLQDKLINIVELANQYSPTPLILAAIDQKIKSLKFLDFDKLLNFKSLWKYLKYLLFVIIWILGLIVINSNIIKEGSQKFINYSKYYPKPVPISFQILNRNLKVLQGKNITVFVRITGKFMPQSAFIILNNHEYLMQKSKKHSGVFFYTLKNLDKNLYFKIRAAKYYSREYEIKVIPIPKIKDYVIHIVPPRYTHLKIQIYKNITEFSAPHGSIVETKLYLKNADSILVKIDDSTILIKPVAKFFNFKYRILSSSNFKIFAKYKDSKYIKILELKISVIPDQVPQISVNKFEDSSNFNNLFFVGNISDDYGFSKLTFNYKINNQKINSIKIPINPNLTTQPFAYNFDFSKLKLHSDDKVFFYFEVFDNDIIDGFKSARTQTFTFSVPTPEQLAKEIDSTNKIISDNFSQAQNTVSELIQDIINLQTKLLNQELTQWEKQSILEKIKQKQQQLQKLLNNIAKQNQLLNNKLNSFNQQNLNLLKKQQEIQKLLNNLLNDDLKELMKKINDILQNLQNKNLDNKLNDLKLDYKNLSNKLEQQLQLLKRLSLEEMLTQQQQMLNNLAKLQDSIAKLTKKRKLPNDSISKLQQDLFKKLNEVENNYKKSMEINKELERPLNLKNLDSNFFEIKKKMNKIQDFLNQKKYRKAYKLQEKTSQQLQQLSQKMQQQFTQAQMQANLEDIQLLKKLEQELLDFSFNTEKLYKKIESLTNNSPVFTKIQSQFSELKAEFSIIQDSLLALAKRNPQINEPVNTELRKINQSFSKAVKGFEKQQKMQTLTEIRQILTSANNLTLLLSEINQQLQKMLKNSMPSAGKASNPQNSSNFQSLNQLQQQLEQQLKNILKQLQNAKQNGQQPELDEQLVKALLTQKKLNEQLNKISENQTITPELQQQINQIKNLLNQTKKDIIYQNISTNTIKRQQIIRVKLLEAEKALKQQGYDNKRKAETAQDTFKTNPNTILKKYQIYLKDKESLQLNNLKINNFYKKIYFKYINLIH